MMLLWVSSAWETLSSQHLYGPLRTDGAFITPVGAFNAHVDALPLQIGVRASRAVSSAFS